MKCISYDFVGGIDMLNFGVVFGDRMKNIYCIYVLVGLFLLIVMFDCVVNSDYWIVFRIGCCDVCYKVVVVGVWCG